MLPGRIELTPEEREQERRSNEVIAEMDLATIPVRIKQRRWYGIVHSRRDASYLDTMLAEMGAAKDEVHKTRNGTSALVIMRNGPGGNLHI